MTIESSSVAQISFHDNLIYGLHFDVGDPEIGTWQSRLLFDIDHIVEWVCAEDGSVAFRVAPATLVFDDVSGLSIDLDFGQQSFACNINELSIAEITSMPLERDAHPAAGPYYRWQIALNLPQDGEIAFAASGFSLSLRAEPTLHDQPRLSAAGRPHAFR